MLTGMYTADIAASKQIMHLWYNLQNSIFEINCYLAPLRELDEIWGLRSFEK